MLYTAISDWLGNADPIEPDSLRYVAAPAWVIVNKRNPERACRGCLFEDQRAAVCNQASRLAIMAGIPDCEEKDKETGRTFIYVAAAVDERQLTID